MSARLPFALAVAAATLTLVFGAGSVGAQPCHEEAPPAAASASAAAPVLPADSVYALDVPLTDDAGAPFRLGALAGQPVVITMVYGRCPHVCPLLIRHAMQLVESVPAAHRGRVKVALVSFDPSDTPAFLHGLRDKHGLGAAVHLAGGSEAAVRVLATALDIRYRKLPDGSFGHTSVLTVLDPQGRIVSRQEGGAPGPELKKALADQAAARPGPAREDG
ncbi:MAG: SCO family protein [Myxococcales bacterium]|nr:SCO family protein [Myxococcales bacterium]MCB9524157.1 SCO family protein [Myxococcales bacterium]